MHSRCAVCRIVLGADSLLERDLQIEIYIFLFTYSLCIHFYRRLISAYVYMYTKRLLRMYAQYRTLDNSIRTVPNAIRVFKNHEPRRKSCQCTICSFRVNTSGFHTKQSEKLYILSSSSCAVFE